MDVAFTPDKLAYRQALVFPAIISELLLKKIKKIENKIQYANG